MKLQLLLLGFLIYKFTTTTAQSPGQPSTHHRSLPYTTIQFVQTWGPGYCKKDDNNCIEERKDKFYIHGLWPANSYGDSLRNCKTLNKPVTEAYLKPKVKDIKTRLDEDWPTLNLGSSNLAFWVKQWHWHGVCSTQTISDPKSYFQKGLDAKVKADLLNVLKKAHVEPGTKPYSQHQIREAIRNELGITIYITCVEDDNKFYLSEIYLCMDVHAENFINCPAKRDPGKCGNFQLPSIHFPAS